MRSSETDLRVQNYYTAIQGPKGLKSLEDAYSRGSVVLPVVEKLLGRKKDIRVLDLCCGYGRIAVPLAKRGYQMHGIDLLSSMIRQAKKYAAAEKVTVRWKIGDMRDLPYDDESFQRVICLWNSFNHLLLPSEQKRALKEVERVLVPGGKAYIEMMNGEKEPYRAVMTKRRPLFRDSYVAPIVLYMHDRERLRELCEAAKLSAFKIAFRKFDGRMKILLEISKPLSIA